MSALDMIHGVVYDKGYEDGQRAMKQAALEFLYTYFDSMLDTDTVDPTVIYHELESLSPVQPILSDAERIICKLYLDDLDKHHTCNEYKLLMRLIDMGGE